MIGTLAVVIGFQTSSKIGNAYGELKGPCKPCPRLSELCAFEHHTPCVCPLAERGHNAYRTNFELEVFAGLGLVLMLTAQPAFAGLAVITVILMTTTLAALAVV